MITCNTLPDIFDKKKKAEEKAEKKFKKGDYYTHKETENSSFIKMYALLKTLGIKNNDFFLALYDTRLIDIDPFDPDLPLEYQLLVIKECSRNFWYFIREIIRIPVAGSDLNGGKRYQLHRGNLALNWCILNNFNIFLELPRQNFKSVSVDIILLWLYNFGTTNSSMAIMNKDHTEAKSNLARIREYRNALPKYLRFNTRYNEEGRELKLTENKEDAFNPKTRNRLVTLPSATSEAKADQLGRGSTQPVQWMDEFGFIRFNMIIYESASPACEQAAIEAEANGKPHCKIITTTPGDTTTEYGKDADDFRKKGTPFKEDFYDWKQSDVKEYLRLNSDSRFFHAVFSYKQLGRSEKYFEDQIAALGGNWKKVRREILLEWVSVNSKSPFDEHDLEELEEITSKTKLYKSVYIDKYYSLDLYEKIDKQTPIILSCDVSSGSRKDYSTIALINTKTKKCIGSFKNNTIDTLRFSYVIYTIATQLCPNCMIVIERNNVGAAVITNLLGTDIRSKLYYEDNKQQTTMEKMKKGRYVETDIDSFNYGLWTDETKKEQMHEILMKYVHRYKERLAIPKLNEEIQALIYNKRGIIDHPDGGHDDLTMAYLIGMWAYWNSNIIAKFGIMRYPDVDPSSGMTEQQQIAMEEEKRVQSDKNAARAFIQMNNDREVLERNQIKSIKDYYDECDEERIRDIEMRENGTVSFSGLFGSSNNTVNLNGELASQDFGTQLVNSILSEDF